MCFKGPKRLFGGSGLFCYAYAKWHDKRNKVKHHNCICFGVPDSFYALGLVLRHNSVSSSALLLSYWWLLSSYVVQLPSEPTSPHVNASNADHMKWGWGWHSCSWARAQQTALRRGSSHRPCPISSSEVKPGTLQEARTYLSYFPFCCDRKITKTQMSTSFVRKTWFPHPPKMVYPSPPKALNDEKLYNNH